MNVPAIAKSTFELLKNQPEYLSIARTVLSSLKKIKNNFEKARFLHNVVDEYNKEVFSHPLLKEFVPCRSGCSACCHTQVSVTKEEAELLIHHVENGLEIDFDRLAKQSEMGNNSEDYYKLSYQDRKCIFLDDKGACRVYKDRPAVCRTNAVIGTASQCDTSQAGPQSLRLVKTSKADMAIFSAYTLTSESGTLPFMVAKLLKEKNKLTLESFTQKIKSRITNAKPLPKTVSKDPQL